MVSYKLTSQSNNETMRSQIINSAMFTHARLSQKNIINFKQITVTKHLIFEGLDAMEHVTLLANLKVSSLAQPIDGVWLGVWHCCQI